MLLFSDLQSEVKRRSTRDQSGTTFDTAVKNVINTSIFRIAREGLWRPLRRSGQFTTVTSYTTGSGAVAVTEDSTAVTITGATLLTDDVRVGRYIKIQGSNTYFKIATITGETTLTLDSAWDSDTDTDATYEILPQEEYNLPIQASHRMFLWHREFGYPTKLEFVTDQSFYGSGTADTTTGVPTHYRMWGEDMINQQLLQSSTVRIYSSSASDASIAITVFGVVAGYPDYETITTTASGTTKVIGSKSFSSIERIVKNASTTGRITVDANLVGTAADTLLAVLPVGDTTAGIQYKKVQLYPLPDSAFDVYVRYYKDPYRLVSDGDVHELGQDFDEAIILLSVAKIKYETSQNEADKWFALYRDELKSLRKTNSDKPDWIPTLSKPNQSRIGDMLIHSNLSYNQLGGYYGPRTRR